MLSPYITSSAITALTGDPMAHPDTCCIGFPRIQNSCCARERRVHPRLGLWSAVCDSSNILLRQHSHHSFYYANILHPIYANILETGVSGKNKRLFLESLHSFLDKNSVNERAPFPRVYASLVASLGGNEQ